jgi:hypothetical protein
MLSSVLFYEQALHKKPKDCLGGFTSKMTSHPRSFEVPPLGKLRTGPQALDLG